MSDYCYKIGQYKTTKAVTLIKENNIQDRGDEKDRLVFSPGRSQV